MLAQPLQCLPNIKTTLGKFVYFQLSLIIQSNVVLHVGYLYTNQWWANDLQIATFDDRSKMSAMQLYIKTTVQRNKK